jgi:hypothetical protein
MAAQIFEERLTNKQKALFNNQSCDVTFEDKNTYRINDIDDWMTKINRCFAQRQASATDSTLQNTGNISDTFEEIGEKKDIAGGQFKNAERMSASGNQYDCLIHSFLTCVTCVTKQFEQYSKEKRDVIASIFRRIVLPELFKKNQNKIYPKTSNVKDDQYNTNWTNIIQNLIAPYDTNKILRDLSTGEADLLAKLFQINIIIIRDSATPSNRSIEICPYKQNLSQVPDEDDYIVIHGMPGHFEPVRFRGGVYLRKFLKKPLKALQTAIYQQLEHVSPENIIKGKIQEFNNMIDTYISTYKTSNLDEDRNIVLYSITNMLAELRQMCTKNNWTGVEIESLIADFMQQLSVKVNGLFNDAAAAPAAAAAAAPAVSAPFLITESDKIMKTMTEPLTTLGNSSSSSASTGASTSASTSAATVVASVRTIAIPASKPTDTALSSYTVEVITAKNPTAVSYTVNTYKDTIFVDEPKQSGGKINARRMIRKIRSTQK